MGQGNRKSIAASKRKALDARRAAANSPPPPSTAEAPTSLDDANEHDQQLAEHLMAYMKLLMEYTSVAMHGTYAHSNKGASKSALRQRIYLLHLHTNPPIASTCLCRPKNLRGYCRDLQGEYMSSSYFDLALFHNTYSYKALLRCLAQQPGFRLESGYYAGYECTPHLGQTNERVWLHLEPVRLASSIKPVETATTTPATKATKDTSTTTEAADRQTSSFESSETEASESQPRIPSQIPA